MTYFHTREGTIIGAGMFHGPVRDGKGWFHAAMVVRHKGEGGRRSLPPEGKKSRGKAPGLL